jgi:nitroreductase
MTSAALVGDSCPIEGFHQEKQQLYYERSSTWIQRNGLSFMVAFGYRKADPANPKSRRKIEDIVTWK